MLTTIVTVEKMQFTLGILSKKEYNSVMSAAKQKQEEAIDEHIGCFVSAMAGTNEDYENPIMLQFTFEDKDKEDILCCICEGALPKEMMEEIGTTVVKEALCSQDIEWETVAAKNFKKFVWKYFQLK